MPGLIIQYPEWRPDISHNVGSSTFITQSQYLITCQGVRAREDFYEQHPDLNTAPTNAGGTTQIVGAFSYSTAASGSLTAPYVYAGTGTTLKRSLDAGSTAWTSMTIPSPFATSSIVSWRFAVTWEESPRIVAACRAPGEIGAVKYPRLLISNTTGTTFTEVVGDDTPSAAVVACVGQFVVVGQGSTVDSANPSNYSDIFLSGVRWSSINDPTAWPEINSAAALAAQSGMQNFPPDYGYVTFIAPITDRVALVFQQRAIHRMTYIGGDLVWQFDTLSTNLGNEEIHSATQVSGWVYFCHRTGFYRTNGEAIEPIGEGRVDRYFQTNVYWTKPLLVQAARDDARNLVYWVFPDSSDTTSATNALIYNYAIARWTVLDLTSSALEYAFTFGGQFDATLVGAPQGFDTAHKQRAFTNSTTFTSIIRTGDANLNQGGVAMVSGVRPICYLMTSTPTIDVYSRMDLASGATATTSTVNTRSNIHNMRATGRYQSVRAEFASATVTRIAGIELIYENAGML